MCHKFPAFFKLWIGFGISNLWHTSDTVFTSTWPPLVQSQKGRKEFNDELVPVLQHHEKFVYLGKPLTVAGEFEEHSKEIIEEYSNLLHLISISVAPVSIKIEALEVIALSKIVHHFANTRFNEDQLNELDTLLKLYARSCV